GDTGFSNASIPQSMAWAGFNSFWSGSTVVMTLTTPSGIEIDKNAAGVFYEHGSTYETYKIPNPEPGQWIIKLFGEDVPQSGEDVMVVVSGEPTDPTLAVNVDIKPGEEPNSVNCTNANGLITVAILTTPDFDALSVDHTKVSFGLTGIEASEHHVKKNGDMVRHEKDVDRDGDKDLVFHFRYGNTSLDCDSKQAVLIGETNDGLQVMGIDEIRMVGSLAKGEDLAGEVSSPEIPDKFSLGAAYPNPFNPVTHISYGLPVPANIKIDIYDILGRKIKTLINEQKEAGFHTITIDGSALSSGIYLYRLEAVPMTPGAENIFVKTQKMVLTK
ncbi:MAG: T9SS type A sorting domain-containing protein, partial [Calditrichia bacterium]